LNTSFDLIIDSWTLEELTEAYPVARDFFLNLNLPPLNPGRTLADALLAADDAWLAEFGLTCHEIPAQLAAFLSAMTAPETIREIASITIIGGRNKLGEPEDVELRVEAGTVVSVVGPTGSGKSRLLGDIECLAQGDTPTKRRVILDGKALCEDERFSLEGKIVAQLSQNMNFVMDLTVAEFLEMHARSRAAGQAPAGKTEQVVQTCFSCANDLAGEKFSLDTKVTLLSGGQSRALMVADCAYMSSSPIVLIDEIENAGVDRRAAITLLARKEKIVLISTHDPLLALSADKRVIIKNGGIFKVLETSPEEKASLAEIGKMDDMIARIRRDLRHGERIKV
jgi:ABC-type lipoprotein export system ATPase subunit